MAYRDVYPGVDVVYHGNGQQLEYDFVVAPGTNPRQIRLSVAGADQLRIEMVVIARKARVCKMRGTASVDGEIVAEATAMCVLQDKNLSV